MINANLNINGARKGLAFPTAGLELNASVRDGSTITDQIGSNDIQIMPAYLNQRIDITTKRGYRQGSEFDILTSDFTVCGWVKVNGDSGDPYQALFGKSPGVAVNGSYGFLFERSSMKILYSVGADSVTKTAPSSVISYGDWHFVMIEIDQTNKLIRYYFDNLQVGLDITFTGSFDDLSARYFAIGVRDFSGSPISQISWAGYSDIKIYKRLLSSTEKSNLFNKTNEPKANIHYPCNNNFFTDISGNGLHLTDPFPTIDNDIDYSQYGSTALMDYGYDLYDSKENEKLIYAPYDYNGSAITLQDITSDYTVFKHVTGKSNRFNLSDAKLNLILPEFDRSDATIYNDNARSNYYDALNPTVWHVSELDNFNFYYVSNVNYKNRKYIKILNDSYSDRVMLEKILMYSSEQSEASNARIIRYCGDLRHPSIIGNKSGIALTLDDLARAANWDAAETYLRPLYPDWKATLMLNGNNATGFSYMPNLLSKGHEAGNHTVNHIDWKTYLETHTVQEFYNTEVLPQQQTIFNELGVTPTTFGYAQVYGFNNDELDSYLLNNGFTFTRPAVNPITELTLNRHIYYYGKNQVVFSSSIGNFSDDLDGQKEIERLLSYAIKYNLIVVFVGHNIDLTNTTNDFFNVKVSRLEATFDFMASNGMSFYTCNELLPNLY